MKIEIELQTNDLVEVRFDNKYELNTLLLTRITDKEIFYKNINRLEVGENIIGVEDFKEIFRFYIGKK